MHNASGHTYSNSSFIVNLAVGRCYVPQNVFLVNYYYQKANAVVRNPAARVTDTTQHLSILRSELLIFIEAYTVNYSLFACTDSDNY